MLFKSSLVLLICSSVLFILSHSEHSKRDAPNYEPRCSFQSNPVDQVVDYPKPNQTERGKRFVLFPEFIVFLGDWRYVNLTDHISYWIANFYPQKVDTAYVDRYVREIFRQINLVLDKEILFEAATDPGQANFHINLFDYTKCPTDADSGATTENVQILRPLLIYSVELTRKYRYRAHGGIHFENNDRLISTVKLNMQQKYILCDDLIYEPTIYTCNDDTNECEVDLFWVLLHEILHGFAIEHTTNAQQPIAPNKNMQSVMHFSNLRMLCHDDIRAIRTIYRSTVIRENAVFDDTCRRDFPMSFLQRLMRLITLCIIFGFLGFVAASLIVFILTLIYILIRNLLSKRQPSIPREKPSKAVKPILKTKTTNKPHGYLWHDDMI